MFLDYSNVVLFKQIVNVLRLSTADEKLKIIIDLQFFRIFKNLKDYFDLTDYIHDHIYYYAVIVKLLQNLKTTLLKTAFKSDLNRRKFTNKTKIQLVLIEIASFNALQKVFNKSFMLYHFVAINIL